TTSRAPLLKRKRSPVEAETLSVEAEPGMTGPDAGITSTDPTREEGVMRALVVYESMFGNTQAVARAVAEGMSPRLATEVVEVGTAPATVDQDVSVLVVGAPTHGMTLSRPDT